MKNVLESLIGKTLKNTVITVVLGDKALNLNAAAVVSVGDVVELTVEGLDYKDRATNVRKFIRLSDIASVTFPGELVEKVVTE